MTLRISPEIHFVIYPIHASSSYHTHSALKETHPPSHALLPDVTPIPPPPFVIPPHALHSECRTRVMNPRRRIKSPHVCTFWNLHQKAFPTTKSPRVPSFRECWTLCGFPLGAMWDQSQPFSCAGYAAFSCVGPTITCSQSRVRHVVADHPAPVLSVMIIAIGSVQSERKIKKVERQRVEGIWRPW